MQPLPPTGEPGGDSSPRGQGLRGSSQTWGQQLSPRGVGAPGGALKPLELVPPCSWRYTDWVVLSFP